MADQFTTSFPKMGDEGIPHSFVNMSGARSPYTKTMPRKTMGRGKSPTGVKANRGASMINEAHGPKFRPVATLYKQNAAAASDNQRKTYTVQSALGDRDFWKGRKAAQSNG